MTTRERDKGSPVQDDTGEADRDQTMQSLLGSLKVSPRGTMNKDQVCWENITSSVLYKMGLSYLCDNQEVMSIRQL